ncbi:MAG TPA: hypothetical protein VFA68_21395 [Terriglobales bacterium]|nr:hypothetical protein [Terriglobales bacterium]
MRKPLLLTLILTFLPIPLLRAQSAQASPEMARLGKALLGTWDGRPHSGDPGAGKDEGKARQLVERGPAGNSLIQNYRGGTRDAPVVGHGVLWWDGTEHVYRTLWCDSDLPSGCRNPSAGNWIGNDLVFSQQREVNGQRVSSRAVYTDIRPDSYTFFFEIRRGDLPAQRILTIHYTRAH